MSCSFVHTFSYDTTWLVAQFVFSCFTPRCSLTTACPAPLQVRAQEVLANIRAALELPIAQVPNAVAQGPNAVAQGPNAASAPAHVAASENADAGNNRNATILELQLEVNNRLSSY